VAQRRHLASDRTRTQSQLPRFDVRGLETDPRRVGSLARPRRGSETESHARVVLMLPAAEVRP
jgi:hypothetical protein